ncbi:MAG: type II toxin-antitoxin system VapC family toxin [Azospirillaceae bacterium]|nr:type II toxin-antitoxin system VapC family toxin [Azospirillaceae bacterium]
MRLLLDSHILLWWLTDDPALPAAAKAAIGDPTSDVFVSAATAWELAVKCALGRLEFPIGQMAAILDEAGFTPLGIEVEHAVIAGALPRHHNDPFDRMLIAQAQHEGMTILTVDPMIRRYAVAVLGGSNN